LLTGAAVTTGLALGAGGVELVHSGTGGPGIGASVPSPGEELMVEHGVLKRLLLAYRTVHDRLVAGRRVDGDVIVSAAQIISDYVEGFHEGLEEAYVFPRVAPHAPGLVRTLLVQHDRGRHLTAAINDIASAGLGRATDRATLATRIAAFVRMYEPHEAWEDTVVFPTLRQVTPQRTLDQLAERFAELENSRYGDSALGAMLARVTGIEAELGIGDLNEFTPVPL
jgi:hemerythrin-like domain-containing protein